MGQKRSLTQDELSQLIGATDLRTPVGVRNAALVLLMAATGAKTSELVGKEAQAEEPAAESGLRLDDLDLKNHRLRITSPSGERHRWMALPLQTEQFLRTWLSVRPAGSPFVFVTSRGTRLQNRYVRRMLRELGTAAGIAIDVKPSVLRRTYASRVLSQTGSLVALQAALGQQHLASTVRYLDPEPAAGSEDDDEG